MAKIGANDHTAQGRPCCSASRRLNRIQRARLARSSWLVVPNSARNSGRPVIAPQPATWPKPAWSPLEALYSDHDHRLILLTSYQQAAADATSAWGQAGFGPVAR